MGEQQGKYFSPLQLTNTGHSISQKHREPCCGPKSLSFPVPKRPNHDLQSIGEPPPPPTSAGKKEVVSHRVGGDRRMCSPSHPPAAATPTNRVWAQPAGQRHLFWPAPSLQRMRPRESKGCIELTQPVWGEDGNSNPALLVANLWLFPLNLSTPWFEARLKIRGDLLQNGRKHSARESANTYKRSKGK